MHLLDNVLQIISGKFNSKVTRVSGIGKCPLNLIPEIIQLGPDTNYIGPLVLINPLNLHM